jgi:lysophospholipase L1-like esterase
VTTSAASPRLRVAILGNSVPLLVVPERSTRSEGTYGEVLEHVLAASGIEATVSNCSRLFELIHEGSRRYGTDIAALQPDVVIFHYGILELQPNVLPTALTRHLTKVIPSSRGVRRLWYAVAVPRIWPRARAWQRWASRRAGSRTWRLRPDRFVAELTRLVGIARSTKALVLIVDVPAPGPRLEHFMPGIGRRWEQLQDELRGFVSAHGDGAVRLVEVSAIASSLPGGGTADGLHLTAEGHALLAARLGKEIVDHLATDLEAGPP